MPLLAKNGTSNGCFMLLTDCYHGYVSDKRNTCKYMLLAAEAVAVEQKE
jgi:hypothetical protein